MRMCMRMCMSQCMTGVYQPAPFTVPKDDDSPKDWLGLPALVPGRLCILLSRLISSCPAIKNNS